MKLESPVKNALFITLQPIQTCKNNMMVVKNNGNIALLLIHFSTNFPMNVNLEYIPQQTVSLLKQLFISKIQGGHVIRKKDNRLFHQIFIDSYDVKSKVSQLRKASQEQH